MFAYEFVIELNAAISRLDRPTDFHCLAKTVKTGERTNVVYRARLFARHETRKTASKRRFVGTFLHNICATRYLHRENRVVLVGTINTDIVIICEKPCGAPFRLSYKYGTLQTRRVFQRRTSSKWIFARTQT